MTVMKQYVLQDLNEVILDLSNFIQNGEVIATPGEITQCISVLMEVRDELVDVSGKKAKRTVKYLQ